MKDDELVIIGLINEDKVEGEINLKELRSVFFDLIQVGPMFQTFINQLESIYGRKVNMSALDMIPISYAQVFRILKSPEYLRDVPRFMNSRGTWDNILLIITSLVLLLN